MTTTESASTPLVGKHYRTDDGETGTVASETHGYLVVRPDSPGDFALRVVPLATVADRRWRFVDASKAGEDSDAHDGVWRVLDEIEQEIDQKDHREIERYHAFRAWIEEALSQEMWGEYLEGGFDCLPFAWDAFCAGATQGRS